MLSFSLRCLIYKVHAALRNVAIIQDQAPACQVFFSTFFADHFRSCETARLDYHIFMPLVKYFFQSLNFPLTSPRPLSRTASLEYQPFPVLSTLFLLLFSLLLIFSINHPYIGGASGQFYNTRQKNGPGAENRAGAASLIYPISRG